MFRKLYNWTLELANKPHAIWFLFFIALIESWIFPIPPDVMIIPMVLMARDKALKIVFVATIGTLIGALIGYGIGNLLFETIGKNLLDIYGYKGEFENYKNLYDKWGIWVVVIGAVSPIPFKVVTIASGSLALSLPKFIAAVFFSRGIRFLIEAALIWKFGPMIKTMIEKYFNLFILLFLLLFFGGIYLLKWFI